MKKIVILVLVVSFFLASCSAKIEKPESKSETKKDEWQSNIMESEDRNLHIITGAVANSGDSFVVYQGDSESLRVVPGKGVVTRHIFQKYSFQDKHVDETWNADMIAFYVRYHEFSNLSNYKEKSLKSIVKQSKYRLSTMDFATIHKDDVDYVIFQLDKQSQYYKNSELPSHKSLFVTTGNNLDASIEREPLPASKLSTEGKNNQHLALLKHSDFLEKNGFGYTMDNFSADYKLKYYENICEMKIDTALLPKKNKKLYSKFPDLVNYVDKKNYEVLLDFVNTPDSLEILSYLIEEDQELSFEEIEIAEYYTKDQEPHTIYSKEEFQQWYRYREDKIGVVE